jgi:signal transduction histidine kinase
MRPFLSKPTFLSFALAAMWLALIVLIYLQFRWSSELSQAYSQRLQTSLIASAESLRTDFQADLSSLSRSLQNSSPQSPPTLPTSPIPYRLYFIDARIDQLSRFDPTKGKFQPLPWPPRWSLLRSELHSSADDLASASPRRWFNRPWLVSSAVPALFRATSLSPNSDDLYPTYQLSGFLLLELDLPALSTRYFPPTRDRSFAASALDTRVTIQFLDTEVYDSLPGSKAPAATHSLDLLAPRSNLRPIGEESPWQLRAGHLPGSLDAALSSLRFRNLATGLAVCAILATGIVFLVITTRRAQQLSKLQTDFVASFSHELRTPITAVCMIADNLRDGIPSDPKDLPRYGNLLLEQGNRLRTRVEDILAFAAGRSQPLQLVPTPLQPLIDSILREEAPLLSGFEVQLNLPANLPQVLADPAALKLSITNLVTNAVKYAGTAKWLSISATTQSSTVSVTVSDRGPGIDPADMPNIFEPFYRGQAARSSGIPGSGLGLHLVRSRIVAMGGRLNIHSQLGQGTAITLHLRSVPQ